MCTQVHPERVEQAKNAGAILEESIASLTSNVDVVCTMVGFLVMLKKYMM